MSTKVENLNIDYHNKLLAMEALSISKNIKEASALLGIDTGTIYNWIRRYKIYVDRELKITKDNFNIRDNYKNLAIKALNTTKTYKEAADLIGISLLTLYNWMKLYNIPIDKNRIVIRRTCEGKI